MAFSVIVKTDCETDGSFYSTKIDRYKVHNPGVQLFKVSLQSQIKTNTQKVLTLTSTSARQFNIGIGSFLSLFY